MTQIAKLLNLTRPIIFFDVETHAKVPPEQARICELGFKIIYPDEREPKEWCCLVNPTVPIATDASELHHITNADVQSARPFVDYAKNIASGFRNCDYGGYHIRFDIRVMQAEMKRCGIDWSPGDALLLDAMHLWRVAQPRTLSDAVREFLGREPSDAHRALDDAKDSLDVAEAELLRFPSLPRTLKELHDLCFDINNVDPDGKFIWINGQAACNFGKHGQAKTLLRDMPKSYLQWMLNGDFSTEVRNLVRNAIDGKYPVKS
jgi:DNA polymerase-3 subunit epsilon